jgi:hypothetical protein
MARPRFHPSDEQRRQVKSMAAFGMRETEIAQLIGIRSPKNLRKHFRAELGRGAAEANGNVANALYKMALSGKYPRGHHVLAEMSRPLARARDFANGLGAGGPFSGVTRSGERMNVRLRACTPAEAKLIGDILEGKRRVIETVELEARIQALESTHVRPVYTAESEVGC